MATQTLVHSAVRPSEDFFKFGGIYSGKLPALPLRDVEEAIHQPDNARISTASGLSCARGVMYALAIEATTVIATIGLYLMWRS